MKQKKLSLRKLLPQILHEHSLFASRFRNAKRVSEIKGFGLPLGSRKLPLSSNGTMLCGDAANLIDPATGEGIGQAMVSGRYAGWMAKECFEENRFDSRFLKSYDHQVYQKLWRENYSRYIIQRTLRRAPWMLDFAIEFGNKSPWFKRKIEGITW